MTVFEIALLVLQGFVIAPALWIVRLLWRLDRRLYRVELHLRIATD